MKTYVSATFKGYDTQLQHNHRYSQVLITHYFLGNKVRVQPCHGNRKTSVFDDYTYDNPIEFLKNWDVHDVIEKTDAIPKQRRSKDDE